MKKFGAIYARLSREDEDKIDGSKESRSIENQIKVLNDYATKHDIEIFKIYCDDGYSGSNQDRPNFQKMLNDIYEKKFNILLIKDISRLGRVLHQVGELIEKVFPENNIRVISLGDNYDSHTYIDNESIVLRNFLNSYYLKDFKRKCRKALEHRARTRHLNYYPKYGYFFDADKKEQIDPYSSNVVKKIFTYAKEGKTTNQIAGILNETGILTRSRYAVEVLKMKPLNKTPAKKWSGSKVWEILKDYEYCGHSLNLLKSGKPVLVKNTHHAIVSEDLFQKANQNIQSRKVKKSNINHLGSILKDEATKRNLTYIQSKNDDYYYSKIGHYSVKAKTIHSFLYKECINLIEQCAKNSEEVKEIYRKRILNAKATNKEELDSKLVSLNNEYSTLLQDFFNKKVAQIDFDRKSYELVNKIKKVEREIEEFNNLKSQITIYEAKFFNFLESIKNTSQSDIDLIKMVISQVFLSKDLKQKEINIKIVFKFAIQPY